ncbi:MAG: CHAT domain-containing protein [Gemmatimonadales bacterium]
MSTPVVFLAFANDADAHLDLLKNESKNVFAALRELDRQEFVKVHREESAGIDDLFDALSGFKDQVAVFHYGGHADGMTLRLEGGAAHAGGIAGLLGEQTNLKLVFLNGCATRPQVEKLLAAGVKAVIATSVPIRDDKATEFAARFYQALASRRTIGQAFALAQAFLQTKYGDVREVGVVKLRGVDMGAAVAAGDMIPWGLYVKEEHEADVVNWKLPYYQAVGLTPDLIQYINSSFTANRFIMQVLDEMARYNPDINTQMMEVRGGESVKRDSREYPELIVRNFPWPLGSQIRLLRQQDSPGAERLENLVSAYVRTSQLLYYILLSNLWEQSRLKRITVPQPFDAGLTLDAAAFAKFDFLAKTIELYRLFHDQGVAPYVAEYERVAAAWDDAAAPLQKAHAYLEELRTALQGSAPPTDLEQRCLTAEQALSIVLRAAAFLASYRMLTVRNIAVEATRFEAVKYELDLGPLNAVDSSALGLYQDVARRRKARLSNSQSIVLARDEDKLDDCLNLSPFIIDKNTFVSVKKGEGADTARLAHIFMLSYVEAGRLVYLAVDHGIRYALENDRDRVHTDMTREDFTEGRNLTPSASAPDPFGLGASGGVAPTPKGSPAESGVKVFQVLRDQLESCVADLGAAS